MQDTHQPQCEKCMLANTVLNQSDEDTISLFLVCREGHVLCQSCYHSYLEGRNNNCPFDDGSELLRTSIPVKGYLLGSEIVLIQREADFLLQKNVRKEEIEKQINIIVIPPLPQTLPRSPKPSIQTIYTEQDQELKNQLQTQRQKLSLNLEHLRQDRLFRNFLAFLILDTLWTLLQLAGSALQLYTFIASFNTIQYEFVSIVFYLIVFFLTTIFVNLKFLCHSYEFGLLLFFCPPLFYLKVLLTNQHTRWQIYWNRYKSSTIFKSLTFQRINYSFYLGKIIIFFAYYFRYYDIKANRLNSCIFAFTVLEAISLIASDISYYRLLHGKQSQ